MQHGFFAYQGGTPAEGVSDSEEADVGDVVRYVRTTAADVAFWQGPRTAASAYERAARLPQSPGSGSVMTAKDACPTCNAPVASSGMSRMDGGYGAPGGKLPTRAVRENATCPNGHKLERVLGAAWHLSEHDGLLG